MTDDPSFRTGQRVAWLFHRASSRWTYNVVEPPGGRAQMPSREDVDAPFELLPAPEPLTAPLGDVLDERASCRSFDDRPIGLEQLSTVLRAGYGVTRRTEFGPIEFLERPVPSGGGLYPLELYVIARSVERLLPGIHHYVPLHHGLERIREGPLPGRLTTYLFMGQPYATAAAAVVLLTAIPGRSLWKYGDRGYRYLLLEAGHVAQNLNLATVALGLGSCNLGGFFDDEVASLVRADVEEEIPLYAVALGVPATADRDARRAID